MSQSPAKNIVSKAEWLAARKSLLAKEKKFIRERDELGKQRRELPWFELQKQYEFAGPSGPCSLSDLFQGRSQLIIYHFMMVDGWDDGCPSCSMWTDGVNGTESHFKARDISFVMVSSANIAKLLQYKKRMQWNLDWYSCKDSAFNQDFGVSFTPEQLESGDTEYNYSQSDINLQELPGVSVFCKNDGRIYHTYSTYARGLDNLSIVYQYLDLTAKGRDEDELDFPMSWIKRHDEYE